MKNRNEDPVEDIAKTLMDAQNSIIEATDRLSMLGGSGRVLIQSSMKGPGGSIYWEDKYSVPERVGNVLCGVAWDKGALEAKVERLKAERKNDVDYYEKIYANMKMLKDYYQHKLNVEKERSWWSKLWNKTPSL